MTFTARTFATLTLIFMLLTATASAQSYIWRPELSAQERAQVAATLECIDRFGPRRERSA